MVIMKQPSKDPFEMAYEEEQDSPIESPTANDDVVTGIQSTADEDNNQNNNLNNNNDDKMNGNANNPSTSGATPLPPTTTTGKNKDDEEEEEEENMDMELGKFPSTGDPDKMAKMQAILSQFTEEQMSRYESFRRSGFQKANMKKVRLWPQ
ncbi:transcription initiation factor TFIID subunit 11-like [Thalictrum thalictroides]|uniref:Transcription initiation factor TFIID subunit 11-like n=1 Tax=Thalictrum thalictroides TaxID=46969 RepID=A0A7J6VCH6_THATH|nr:transcription initiation factor TFIID subunit 11-like [Thalictrum thalictroides]